MEGINVVGIAVIVGVVKGIVSVVQEYTKVEINSVYGVVLSLGVGVILGFLGLFGLNLETGIISALAGTGVYQLAKKVGGDR